MDIPELLAPAGDLEKLKAAVVFGADAVYLGGKQFSLRERAGNFTLEEIAAGVEFAHARGVKVYVTVNIFARNRDLDDLPIYLKQLEQIGVDAVIVSDPGVLTLVRETAPGLPVHLSTQANTTNWKAARFWQEQGVSRIILARELGLEEIREIRRQVTVPLEIFVHGAMCISYSGRCLLSSYMTGRDANRGDCAQACRWRYALVEEKRPGEYFPLEEDSRGTYILSSRDLCLLEYIPQLVEAGINSLKIEGRVKSIHYVATVVSVYRQALDAYRADPGRYRVRNRWLEELGKVSHREYTTGFFAGPPVRAAQGAVDSIYLRPYTFTGVVREYDPARGLALVEQRNRFARGEVLEVLLPGGETFSFTVTGLYDENMDPVDAAPHPRQRVFLSLPRPVLPWSLLRRREEYKD
ncbi:putative protease [Desulfofundulus australicus DSM 11792]|uniref:Putative protease n=1 Tax=Desulfofundulus australicus DSM 11792 TaxID=1121425 RepID=A0A1M4YA79_9FIRM|nr:U32 family peptidase [Desulfofundulus australicus]SHF02422.1 putative protease [Desulfofundulus australicus DSM 11792]